MILASGVMLFLGSTDSSSPAGSIGRLPSDTDPDAVAKNDIIVDLIVQCLRFALGHGPRAFVLEGLFNFFYLTVTFPHSDSYLSVPLF